jgi:multiple sugar transport system ATP-binding protein
MVAAAQGIPGMTFSAVIDVLESLGADEFAYFHIPGVRASAQELEELAADAGSDDVPGAGEQIVARLDPASRAREGQKLELWFDPRKVHLFNPETFNPETGAHITL